MIGALPVLRLSSEDGPPTAFLPPGSDGRVTGLLALIVPAPMRVFTAYALEPVSNLQLNLNVSPAIIEWTASISDQTCIDGYEVCWTVTTYLHDAESTNLTCHNVTKDVTSSTSIGQPHYCIDYIAIVVTFGMAGLRSQSIYTNETALTIPPIGIDIICEKFESANHLINISRTATSNSIIVEAEALLDSKYCINVLGACIILSNDSVCIKGNATEVKLTIDDLQACSIYNTSVDVTPIDQNIRYYSEAISTNSANSTMIRSLVVEDITSKQVTVSWEPVYQGSPCATHYRVCHKEQNSTAEPDCSVLARTSNKTNISNLKSLTYYTVEVSALLANQIYSDIVTETFRTSELTSVDMWEGVNLVWFVDEGAVGAQIPTGYTEIKMLLFTVVFVLAGTVLVKCQNCTELESVSSLSLNVSTSPAIIEWTASNSSQECLEGYEVCLVVTTHHNTTTSCSNVTVEVTSFTAGQQIQHCVDYTATVTAFSIDGLRSNPSLTTHLYYPEFFIDNVINISRTVNSSSIILEAHTLPSYSLCTIHMVACMGSEFGSMCLDGTETEVKIEAHQLFACTYYSTAFYVTTSVESTMSDILQIYTNNSEMALIESVSVGNINPSNVTLSWQPVYLLSPCLANYRVCHLEHNSLGEPSCSTLSSNLTTTILSDLKTLTNYTVNVSAIFPDETDSDVISITFRTSVHPPETRDSNLDIPVIGSLVYFESSALDHVATGAVA
uniref:Fibronectin type-III domain-containing protein n=1 Tax=Timema poppense TaxID=170557 RepID=A0A7R9CS92_TIMPO|nr:unnamed protein product [Timema poppensis]